MVNSAADSEFTREVQVEYTAGNLSMLLDSGSF